MQILNKVQKYKKTGIIGLFLILTFLAGNSTQVLKPQQHVLSATTHALPSPTSTPMPTAVPVTVINNIYLPTSVPQPKADGPLTQTPTSTPTPTPATPTPTPSIMPTEAISTPMPTGSPTATPQPKADGPLAQTPIPQTVSIDIDYAGEHAESTYSVSITSGETAWQAVQDAVGLANIQYTDYGGDLGIFITGFNGVDASSNQYYDFQVNGASSNVGVSSYQVANGDVLKFVLTSF